ncbi:MAG TPA: hypothetical protein VH092_14650, partial [Urbifossiella sp.]|nr:hypothetical protein [Urbifossiella sp.]
MSDEDLLKLTAADWAAGVDSYPLLDFLRARTRNRVDKRRLRLLSCAWCREVWHLLTDDRSRHAIEVAERHADGLATNEELAAAHTGAHDVARPQRKDPFKDAVWSVSFASMPDVFSTVDGYVAWALAKEASKKSAVREVHRKASHARHADMVR